MRKLGIIFLSLGIMITGFSAFHLFDQHDNIKENELKAGTTTTEELQWMPIIGVSVLLIGTGMYVFGAPKKDSSFYMNYKNRR